MKNTLSTFIVFVFVLASIGGLITTNSSLLSNYLSFTAAKTASYSPSSNHSQRVWKTTGDVGMASGDNHFMLSKCLKGDSYVRDNLTGSVSEYTDSQMMAVIRESNKLCDQ